MKVLLVILSVILCCSSFAQNTVFVTDTLGSVIVNKDPRVDILSAKQAEINKRAARLSSSGHVRGYRIQVANTQNRDEANAVKTDMLRRFPDQKAYMLYQAPSFRVRVGNFLTQKDAFTMRKMIASLYPNKGIYIVPDLIEYTIKDDEDLPE